MKYHATDEFPAITSTTGYTASNLMVGGVDWGAGPWQPYEEHEEDIMEEYRKMLRPTTASRPI